LVFCGLQDNPEYLKTAKTSEIAISFCIITFLFSVIKMQKPKLGQLFIIELKSDSGKYYTEYNSEIEKLIKQYKIGGFILFKQNIISKIQIRKFIQTLQKNSEVPLFIAIDEEGGRVSRLRGILKEPAPAHSVLGEINNPKYTYKIAAKLGSQLKHIGINLDFAPVADTLKTSANSMIGDRSFSGDARIVMRHSFMFYQGLADNGIISCPKHFPGCGDTTQDLHKGIFVSNLKISDLIKFDLPIYLQMIKFGCHAIMVGHNSFKHITERKNIEGRQFYMPASLSHNIITGLLRRRLRYKNLIITDSLRMSAITNIFESSSAAQTALTAGVDILLMPANFYEVVERLNSIVNGNLPKYRRLKKQIFYALNRIQKVKNILT